MLIKLLGLIPVAELSRRSIKGPCSASLQKWYGFPQLHSAAT